MSKKKKVKHLKYNLPIDKIRSDLRKNLLFAVAAVTFVILLRSLGVGF